MSAIKDFFSHKSIRIWAISSAVIVALMVTVNVLALNVYYSAIKIPLGGDRAILAEGTTLQYQGDYKSKEEALKAGNDLNVKLNEQGIVLFKNEGNALPLKKGAKVSVFGKNSVNLVYGGSGSGGGNTSNAKTIFDSLTSAGFSYNPTLKSFYENSDASGSGRTANPKIENSGTIVLETGETPQSSYTEDVKGSYAAYGDAAIVVISRIGGEGFDLPRSMSDDASHHYLQLDTNETALLKAVCESGSFQHVVVVINSSASMELGFLDDPSYYAYQSKIDACLSIGGPGPSGIMALGEVLAGAVTPSGHTVDTYARRFADAPSYQNFGNNGSDGGDKVILKSTGKAQPYYFVDYEEGIYVGYRYYETRGLSDGESWYKDNVVYPFGYGLSYTSFQWDFVNKSALNGGSLSKDGKLSFQVKVTNTGDYPGREVVQIYGAAPYTSGGIEKSAKVLLGFEKTDLLYPESQASADKPSSQTLTIEVDPYDLASFDAYDANKNGFKGYELEKGSYTFYVAHNAHESADSITQTLAADARYDADPVTGKVVQPLFEDADDHLGSILSRSDWTGSFPAKPTEADRTYDDALLAKVKDTATTNPLSVSEMPTQGANYGEEALTLYDMIGKDYDDASWEKLLNEISIDEMDNLFSNAAFNTAKIASIDKPETTDADGPVGFVNFLGDPTIYDTVSYASEVVLGCTWNKDLLYQMGQSVGNEGLVGNVQGDGRAYTGWYAPAVNIHRSPFGGRNFEYFSEDGYFSGMMASSEIQGAASRGVYTDVKHFALNEQETHRANGGNMSWVSEQAMREVFLRPFEKAVKVGHTHGMMSSFNRIGTKWTGGDYRLITKVLREEWGFQGAVICDFNTNPSYMVSRLMAYAGGDLNLSVQPVEWVDKTSAADVTVLRQATKHVLYAVANSNAMNAKILGYKPAVWVICVYCGDGLLSAGILVWGFAVIFSSLRGKKKPKEPKKG